MNVDQNLMYTCRQIKEKLMKDTKEIPRNGEILDMEPFPSAHVLALLARAVYAGGVVELPEGWQYLTTAYNKSRGNGYFGAAYWSPSLQQVVIAHRGTEFSNIGAMWTNYKGVLNTNYTSHMNSAITFADHIMTALLDLNREKGVGLRLSLTGHSLGGWLAQVTAFTLRSVERDRVGFSKIRDPPPCRHVHTVTFDTPGCGDMLAKIIDDGYYRYRKTASPDRLDITNYLAPPNRINTTGTHVGTLHLVQLDLSKFSKFSKNTSWYNIAIHRIDNFVKALEGEAVIREVLDWPVSTGALGGSEYGGFHARADHESDYAANLMEEELQQKTWIKELRYKTEETENSCSLRVFSERELYLLDLWSALKAEKVKMTEISAFLKRHGLETVGGLFADFETDVKNRTVTCRSKASLREVVRRTKQLTWWFPGLLGALERQGAGVPRAGPLLYRMEARNYLASLPEYIMCFEDTVGLRVFLESGETRVLHITTEDSQLEAARLYNLLSQMRDKPQLERLETYLRNDRQTFVDWEKLRDLDRTVDFESLYKSGYPSDDLLVIELAVLAVPGPVGNKNIFKHLFNDDRKKLIIVSTPQNDCKSFLESLNVPFETVNCAKITLADLTEESQQELFSRKMLIANGKHVALDDYIEIQNFGKFLSHINSYTDRLVFKKIMTDQNYTILMESAFLSCDDLNLHSVVNKEMSTAKVARILNLSPDALLVISGLGREELRTDLLSYYIGEERIFTTTENGELVFKQICREKPDSTVFWIAASAEHIFCKNIYGKGFYVKRRFHKIIFNVENFVQRTDNTAIFVFQNVEDKLSLIRRYPISEANKHTFLTSDRVKTAASDEETDEIIKKNPDRPVHILMQEADGGQVLWRRSRGSLEGLRPYVTAGERIDEGNLRDTRQKVVIIADEPGMGKSTTLTSVSRLFPSAWVIRIDLNDFQIAIQKLPTDPTLDSVCEFILGDTSGWLRGLLQFRLDKKHEHSREIHVFFDGFDEIRCDFSPDAEGEAINLLKYLNNETTARVWVTTRLYRREILENALSALAVRFERIGESQQREFLAAFWRPHLLLDTDTYGEAQQLKVNKFAKYVYEKAKIVLGNEVKNFMGIPLQMRMLAEVCLPWVKVNVESETGIEYTFDVTDVLDLYQKFSRLKYDIYFNDKTELSGRMSGAIKKTIDKQITEKHRMLSIRTLFPRFAEENFDDPEDGWGAELCRVGLVQAGGGGRGNVEFIHRTLAEYYCADLVVDWLRKRGRYHGNAPVVELLLTEILLHKPYHVVRIFIDNLVLSESLSEDANKYSASKISALWRENQHRLFNQHASTGLHVAAQEGNTGIVDILVGSFKCAPDQLIAFLSARDRERCTALGRAARAGCREIAEKIVRGVEGCSYKVILELLLATYIRYTSASQDEVTLLQDYLKGEVVYSELKKAFTRTEKIIQEHFPPFLAAVEAGRAECADDFYRKMENDTERLYALLAPDAQGGTALHLADRDVHNEARNKIKRQIIITLSNRNIPAVGRSYDTHGRTPLHCAAAAGHLDVVQHLTSHRVYVDSRTTQASLPGAAGDTALFYAARAGSFPVARYLIEKGADIGILNSNGENALFYAAGAGTLPLTQYLIERGADINILNNNGENALFYAAGAGSFLVTQYLTEKGVDINNINKNGENALFNAARATSLPVVRYLIEKGADIHILNNKGENALFDAARLGGLKMVRYLIDGGLKVDLVNNKGQNILHYAWNPVLVHYLEEKMSI